MSGRVVTVYVCDSGVGSQPGQNSLTLSPHTVNLGLVGIKYKIGRAKLLPENKYLILGSKCFYKRFQLFIVGKIYTKNLFYLRFELHDPKRN